MGRTLTPRGLVLILVAGLILAIGAAGAARRDEPAKTTGTAAPEAVAAMAPLAATDELADATALWRQRFGSAPANQKEKARQVRFLLSRGYGMSVALRVLRMAGASADEDG